jgi:GNAT superfamily N-acetyltransferase
MTEYTIESGTNPEDERYVFDQLTRYNDLKTGIDGNYQPLNLFVRDSEGKIVAGLLGNTYWGWLYVSILWVSEALRGQGYGRKLLRQAEQTALERGAHHAHLDTMSFQALPFYLKEGYTEYGRLDDMPLGHSRYFLQKRLS